MVYVTEFHSSDHFVRNSLDDAGESSALPRTFKKQVYFHQKENPTIGIPTCNSLNRLISKFYFYLGLDHQGIKPCAGINDNRMTKLEQRKFFPCVMTSRFLLKLEAKSSIVWYFILVYFTFRRKNCGAERWFFK